MRRRPIRLLLLGAAAGLALMAGAGSATAQGGGERITDYEVTIVLRPDGRMEVVEDITYDFGANRRRGIYRDLVRRERFDDTHDRLYRLEIGRVTTDPGTPDDVVVADEGPYRRVRIGDPEVFITGVHRYRIPYAVEGGPLTFPDHDELYWDAIGTQWAVPIDRVEVTVEAPTAVERWACFSGPEGSTRPCASATAEGRTATFTETALGPAEGVSVVIALPKGTIQPPPAPRLEERPSLARSFSLTPATGGISSVLALAGVGTVGTLAWRRGRDRRFAGSAVDAAFGNRTGAEERLPLRGGGPGPVEFIPPEKIRPGQVGTLVDERANLVDVTATIIDLAVRGWLRIVEVPRAGRSRVTDYELQRQPGPGTGTLHAYERLLLDHLFASGPTVRLSELKYRFTDELAQVRSALYDDLVDQGWYLARPDRTRARWVALGVLVTALGAAVTVLLAVATTWALVGVPLVLTGVVLTALAGRMPARTGKGSAMRSRVLGFRRLFDEGEEDTRARFAEQQRIFSEYLPYAIVFGCARQWARRFAGLGAEQLGTTGWYSGPDGWTAVAVAAAMDDFGTAATGTLYATQPSSSGSSGFSGGFSGGGGGGGGGGSW